MEPEDEGHRNNRWSLERMRSAQQQRVEPSNSLEEKKKKQHLEIKNWPIEIKGGVTQQSCLTKLPKDKE